MECAVIFVKMLDSSPLLCAIVKIIRPFFCIGACVFSRGCVEWLSDAGIVNVCYCLSFPELPLKGNYDESEYKIYFADSGGRRLLLLPFHPLVYQFHCNDHSFFFAPDT